MPLIIGLQERVVGLVGLWDPPTLVLCLLERARWTPSTIKGQRHDLKQ